jgi:hypothetical protein
MEEGIQALAIKIGRDPVGRKLFLYNLTLKYIKVI